MNEEPEMMRTATLAFAAVFSIPISIIGLIALPFSSHTEGLYNGIIEWGFVAALSILPAFALLLFSLRLLAWYLRIAVLLIYASEFFICWGGWAGTHYGWAGWIPVKFLLAAVSSFIAPQVFLAITVLVFVEHVYRWQRLHAAHWEGEIQ
jgi:hypothetical protein